MCECCGGDCKLCRGDMSGECDVCGEHCLDCVCKNNQDTRQIELLWDEVNALRMTCASLKRYYDRLEDALNEKVDK